VLDVDEIPPVISINGANPITVELGSTYSDAGAIADGGETVSLESNVDTAKVGSYTVTYSATDAAGNIGTATRIVNIIDTTKPIITIIGDNPATAEFGLTYTDAGATASDLSGDVTVITSGSVNTNVIGSYTLTYSATDASGNTGTSSRTIIVQDTTGPQITILGNNPQTVELVQYDPPSSIYKDTAGAISDGGEEIFTDEIDVDNTAIGTYFVYYSATDTSGNKSTVARTVYVVDTTAPRVTLYSNGSTSDEVTVELGSTFVSSGAYATDISMSTGFDTDLGIEVTVTGTVDTSTVGTYTLTYTATDASGNVGTAIETVNVVDTTAPVFTSSATFSAAENQTVIGIVTATDLSGSTLFSIASDEIEITTDGVLSFVLVPDYETKSSYTATVTSSDGTNSTTQNITVNVTDVNEAPAFTSSATFSAAENQIAIGTVTATDADGDSVTFTVSGSELAITSAGVLTFKAAPDYETKSTYTATVTASDGTNTTTQSITVNVTDVNDNSPVFTSSATFSAAENQTAIGTVTASDAEDDEITFTVSGSELAITSAGVLTFVSAPDYETKSTYTATVTASDGTNTSTQDITVNVTDVDENVDTGPVFTSDSTFEVAENQLVIGEVTATDPDGDSISFSTTSTEILIDSLNGNMTFVSPPNFEAKSVYTATILASDGVNESSQDITINITNVVEAPEAFDKTIIFRVLPQIQTEQNITLPADGDNLTYIIVSNPTKGTLTLDGNIATYKAFLNYTTSDTDSFTFKVSNGSEESSVATLSIDIMTDPLYKYQWHLENTGQTTFATNAGTADEDLNLNTVISSGYSGAGVTVAVIDSGLEIGHEDLASNIVAGSYDFLDSDTDPTNTIDVSGDHGTSVAGNYCCNRLEWFRWKRRCPRCVSCGI